MRLNQISRKVSKFMRSMILHLESLNSSISSHFSKDFQGQRLKEQKQKIEVSMKNLQVQLTILIVTKNGKYVSSTSLIRTRSRSTYAFEHQMILQH